MVTQKSDLIIAYRREGKVKKAKLNEQGPETDGNGIVVVKNLTKKFGDNIVLDNISLTIEKGKTTVVIGPSGCGKTVIE